MEMRQLRGFLAVAETLSFSRAAERLYVSQSTLSEQIRQLEDEIGCPLFRRTSHSVSLTEVGERLRPAAAQACRDMEACREVVREMREKISGTLRVGVTSTCKSLLKRPLREMMREYPRLQLQVTYTNGLTLSEMLINKQVDIAVSMRPHRLPPEVEQEAIFSDRLCAICSPTHALCDRKEVSLEEVGSYPMLLPTGDLYYRREIDRMCLQAGIHLEARGEVSDPDYLIELVEHSQLVTLHAGIVAAGNDNLRAIPVSDCAEPLAGCIYRLRDAQPKRSAEELARRIREAAKLHYDHELMQR